MKRTIVGKDYQFEEAEIPIEKLRFWPENPRIYADIYSLYDEDTPDFTDPQLQLKIYDKLKQRNNVRILCRQIEASGLADPLVVRKNNENDTYDVLEGNRRLAACKMILEKGKKQTNLIKKFSSLACEMTPEDFLENHIFALLGTWHITGKAQWEPFAKASYVKRRVEALKREGDSESAALENTGKEIGETKSTVQSFIANIDLMKEANEQDSGKYSFYEVLNSNRITSKDLKNDDYKEQWLDSIKKWKESAYEFRKTIEAATKNQRALNKFRNGNLTLKKAAEQAKEDGSTDAIYQKVSKFRIFMARDKARFKELNVTDPVFGKLKYELSKLKKLVPEIAKILEDKSG